MTASVATAEYDALIQKLMATVNVAIDKATGPEAQSLLQSYMTYVIFQNILNIVILAFFMVLCIYSTKKFFSNRAIWIEKGARDRYGELKDPGPSVVVPGIVSGIAAFLFFLGISGLPKWVAIIYDPRLHFVFKVLDSVK
jgi:hypothetical protein